MVIFRQKIAFFKYRKLKNNDHPLALCLGRLLEPERNVVTIS